MANEPAMFEAELQMEVTASVTHPPGTEFDENGLPIPAEGDDE